MLARRILPVLRCTERAELTRTVSSEQALAMSVDVVQKPNPDALTLEDFNITDPFKMEECAISIVRRFRTVQHFGFVKGYH